MVHGMVFSVLCRKCMVSCAFWCVSAPICVCAVSYSVSVHGFLCLLVLYIKHNRPIVQPKSVGQSLSNAGDFPESVNLPRSSHPMQRITSKHHTTKYEIKVHSEFDYKNTGPQTLSSARTFSFDNGSITSTSQMKE